MNIHVHLKVVGWLLLGLGFAHSFFYWLFDWGRELAHLSLLTRQIFLVHCFFISLSVMLMGVCTLWYTDVLLASGILSRVVLAGFLVFWSIRWAFQLWIYDPAIWRGRRFYTAMHAAFSVLWTYVVCVYGAALHIAWTSTGLSSLAAR